MNTQIKYRFWNKIGRFFEKSDKIAVNKDGDLVLYDYETGEWSVSKIENTCLDVDRFTGLVDKNGKEIYEGDIIESEIKENSERGEFEDKLVKDKFIVEFHRGCFGKIGYHKDIKPLLVNLNYWTIKKYEVIGNIHENPELLK